jgi:hypothetical protein
MKLQLMPKLQKTPSQAFSIRSYFLHTIEAVNYWTSVHARCIEIGAITQAIESAIDNVYGKTCGIILALRDKLDMNSSGELLVG